MSKVKKPSVRARKYLKNKVAGKSDYQAAVDAGYSHNTALNARKKVENGGTSLLLHEAMEKNGLTFDYLVKKIKEGIEQTNDCNLGRIDYANRHRYIETALRLYGFDKSELIDVTVTNQRAYIVLPPENT